MTNACCRLKLDDVNRNKESELAALRQHTSAIEQQLADSNIVSFYRAMLCIRGTSHGPVSVSVTSLCSTKTAKRRITQTRPHDTPGTLVF